MSCCLVVKKRNLITSGTFPAKIIYFGTANWTGNQNILFVLRTKSLNKQECSAFQCHFSFFLSPTPWRLPQRTSLQRCFPGRLHCSPEKRSSFSIEQSSKRVFELCLRPLPPLWNFQMWLLVCGEMLQRPLRISEDHRVSLRRAWAFELLAHKCHTIGILQNLLTVDLGWWGKEEKDLSGMFTVYM